jgi:hypothetical protein
LTIKSPKNKNIDLFYLHQILGVVFHRPLMLKFFYT